MILIVVFLLIAAALFVTLKLNEKEGSVAVITLNGEEYGRYPLSEEREIKIETEDGYNIVLIRDGMVDVIEADCPNLICVNAHEIKNTGETITCVPNRVSVTVVGDDDGVDLTE